MKQLFIILMILSIGIFANAEEKYRVNDTNIETLMDNSAEISFSMLNHVSKTGSWFGGADRNQYVAGGIALGAWAVGLFFAIISAALLFAPLAVTYLAWAIPVHRIYSGTSAGPIVGYVLTCGGCGWLPLIDGIVLLVTSTPDKYYDNNKFLMW